MDSSLDLVEGCLRALQGLWDDTEVHPSPAMNGMPSARLDLTRLDGDVFRDALQERPLAAEVHDALFALHTRVLRRLKKMYAAHFHEALARWGATRAQVAPLLQQLFAMQCELAVQDTQRALLGVIDERLHEFMADAAVADGRGALRQGEGNRTHSPHAIRILENAFNHAPNITQAEKYKLAEATGLQPRQVTIWFQNRRNRRTGAKRAPTAERVPILPRGRPADTVLDPPPAPRSRAGAKRDASGASRTGDADPPPPTPSTPTPPPRLPQDTHAPDATCTGASPLRDPVQLVVSPASQGSTLTPHTSPMLRATARAPASPCVQTCGAFSEWQAPHGCAEVGCLCVGCAGGSPPMPDIAEAPTSPLRPARGGRAYSPSSVPGSSLSTSTTASTGGGCIAVNMPWAMGADEAKSALSLDSLIDLDDGRQCLVFSPLDSLPRLDFEDLRLDPNTLDQLVALEHAHPVPSARPRNTRAMWDTQEVLRAPPLQADEVRVGNAIVDQTLRIADELLAHARREGWSLADTVSPRHAVPRTPMTSRMMPLDECAVLVDGLLLGGTNTAVAVRAASSPGGMFSPLSKELGPFMSTPGDARAPGDAAARDSLPLATGASTDTMAPSPLEMWCSSWDDGEYVTALRPPGTT
ncbi:hypothetical protein MSPP1_000467 [Malassezia sp. CBS 17886]|nr:hypothetical protein MSPP1_000467 [Malassezia sp. CBS 17886]